MTPELLRMIERILIALCGGMSIYLGYRLFITVPFAKTGSGKFEFPKLGKVVLSHIGPGVFFALFGAGILVAGLLQSTKYQEHSIFDSILMNQPPPDESNRNKILSGLDELKKLAEIRGDTGEVKKVEQIIASLRIYLSRSEIIINREAAAPDRRLPGT